MLIQFRFPEQFHLMRLGNSGASFLLLNGAACNGGLVTGTVGYRLKGGANN
jgi:hypothetical protein